MPSNSTGGGVLPIQAYDGTGLESQLSGRLRQDDCKFDLRLSNLTTLSPIFKGRWGGAVTQFKGLGFNPQYWKNKKF